MARTRKPKAAKSSGDAGLKAPAGDSPEPEEEEARGESRPSQLDQIRAAIAPPAATEEAAQEVPELPQPEEEPELPAHVEEEPAAEMAVAEPEQEPAMEMAKAEPEPQPEPEAHAEAEPEAAIYAAAATPTATSEQPAIAPSSGVPPPAFAPPIARVAGASSGLALGIVLVVVGVFFLLMRLFDIDLSSYGWPLYVIIPGVTLLIVGFVSLGTGALVPGGIITIAGLILAYQNATSDWASWAFAWTLVAPGGAGLGVFLQGLRVHDTRQIGVGRNLMFWAALLFMIGFVVFESIFQISGVDYGIIGKSALPVLLIVIGVTLLARSMQKGRAV